MRLKKLLIRNSLASGFGKLSTVLFRFVQVPLLLSALGAEDYGRWLVLYSFPSWIALTNLGFGSVAANEISMAVAAGDDEKARSIFSTVLALISRIVLAGSVVAAIFTPFIPWEVILKTSAAQHNRLSIAVILFVVLTLISFFGDAYAARLRAARKMHLWVLIAAVPPWLELLCLLIILQFSTRFDYMAIAVLGVEIIYVLALMWFSKQAFPTLVFSRSGINKAYYRLLFKKGLSFQAFPLGNALLFQGNLLIIQTLLGPTAVAMFSTVRTLVRSINQMLEMVNQVMWPELSILFGAGELHRVARLHRLGVALSVTIACLSVLFLALFGHTLYNLWTENTILLSQHLLLLFLLPMPFYALWFTSSVVHMASNQHEKLAIRYLTAVGLSVIACASLSYFFGIEGAAVSTLIGDIVLIPYVFKTSLKLTGDTWNKFVIGLKGEGLSLMRITRKAVPVLTQK